jgi:SAM-dependent methyltransferase
MSGGQVLEELKDIRDLSPEQKLQISQLGAIPLAVLEKAGLGAIMKKGLIKGAAGEAITEMLAEMGVISIGKMSGREYEAMEALTRVGEAGLGGAGTGPTIKVPVAAAKAARGSVEEVVQKWEYGGDTDKMRSDERVARAYNEKVKSIDEAATHTQRMPFHIFKTIGKDAADTIGDALKALQQTGVTTRDNTKDVNRVLKKARMQSQVMDQADFDVIEDLDVDPEVKTALTEALRDLNTTVEFGMDKNTRGPVQEFMRKYSTAIGLGAGAKMGVPGAGLVLGGMAQGAGRGLDTVMRTRVPSVLKGQEARTRLIEKAGGDVGNPLKVLEGIQADVAAGKVLATEDRQAAIEAGRAMRKRRRKANMPGRQGFDRYIYDGTGLLPAEVDKGLVELLMRRDITMEQFKNFHNAPNILMAGNQGNSIVDLLEGLAVEGLVTPDPDASVAPQAPAGIRNPIAYEATVRSAEAARDAAYEQIAASGLPTSMQQELKGLTDAVVKAKSKSEKLAIMQSAMQQLHPVAAKTATNLLGPLTQYGPQNPTAAPNNPVVTPDRPAGAGPSFRPRMGRGGPLMAPKTGSGPASVTMPNPAMGQAPAPVPAGPALPTPNPDAVAKVEAAKAENTLPPAENSRRTQVSNTTPTYQKAKKLLGNPTSVLDYGAGLGLGAKAIGADTFEPFPGNQFAGGQPTYQNPDQIPGGSYDAVTSLNVLNVLPREARDAAVDNIGHILKPGGSAVITTRGKEVMTAKGRKGPEPTSIITSSDTYQKGFTPSELVDYLSAQLGPQFTVTKAPSDAGISSIGAVVEKQFNDQDGHPAAISTRMPTKTKKQPDGTTKVFMREGDQDALENDLQIGMEAMLDPGGFKVSKGSRLTGPDKMKRNAEVIRSYPGFTMPDTMAPEDVYSAFKDQIKENLLWVFDSIDPAMRNQTRMWYEGANRLSAELGDRYGRPVEQMSAVMAALSPQKDWYQNYSLGERLTETFDDQRTHQWDSGMNATFAEKSAASANLAALGPKLRGKTLQELIDVYEKSGNPKDSIPIAAWIRMYDETHNGRAHRLISPDGSLGEYAQKGDGSLAGTGWGSLVEISKGVRVLMDGSRESINKEMGTKHKVRNFYNNILDPASGRGEVTIDTHAVAAAHVMPFSGQSRAVHHNFGSSPSKDKRGKDWDFPWADNADWGASGAYGIYADAYREAAAERGVLPREMQSITWEAIRGLFPASWKTAKNVKAVKAIWNRADRGEISKAEARDMIVELAGGFSEPTWVTGIVEDED